MPPHTTTWDPGKNMQVNQWCKVVKINTFDTVKLYD